MSDGTSKTHSARLSEAIARAQRAARSDAPVICYREESEGEGVKLESGRVALWAGGEELVATDAPSSQNLEELLDSYELPRLFPEFEFSHTGEPIEWDLEIDISMTQRGVVLGELCVVGGTESVGESGLWEAQRARGKVFRFSESELQLRPWLSWEREPDSGWALVLPLFISVHPDPVLRKRSAAAVEAFLYSLQAQREISLPYQRRVSSVFSAKAPVWSERTPVLWEEGR